MKLEHLFVCLTWILKSIFGPTKKRYKSREKKWKCPIPKPDLRNCSSVIDYKCGQLFPPSEQFKCIKQALLLNPLPNDFCPDAAHNLWKKGVTWSTRQSMRKLRGPESNFLDWEMCGNVKHTHAHIHIKISHTIRQQCHKIILRLPGTI